MKAGLSALFLLGLVAPSVTIAADYTVQPAASRLGFSGTFQGAAFNGTFGQWSATISYDATNLATSKFDVSISLASAKTADKDRDSALPSADFFNIAKYPQAHFVTTGFHQNGAQTVAEGVLTLHGITKPVTLNVNFKNRGRGAQLDVSGSVKRLDFDIGRGDYADTTVIAADVTISAQLQLVAK